MGDAGTQVARAFFVSEVLRASNLRICFVVHIIIRSFNRT